jgi:hypothetical protein
MLLILKDLKKVSKFFISVIAKLDRAIRMKGPESFRDGIAGITNTFSLWTGAV